MSFSHAVTPHERSAEENPLLIELFRKLNDSTRLFKNLQAKSRVARHQRFAQEQVVLRERYHDALRAELHNMSNDPHSGTIDGMFRRICKDVAAFLPGSERRMFRIVDEGETSLRAAYLRLLEASSDQIYLREKLQNQAAQIGRAQAELQRLQQQL